MEFRFRAGDHRQPPPPPPPLQFFPPRPPAGYCLSEQGFPDAFERTTNIVTLRQPFDSNEEMHWGIELMRLREEKLLGEIERERFLKEEARRELRLFEREMAIRGLAQSAAGYPLRQPQRWVAPPFSVVTGPPFSDLTGPPFSAVRGPPFSDLTGPPFSAVRGPPFSDLTGPPFSAVSGPPFSDLRGPPFSAERGPPFSAVAAPGPSPSPAVVVQSFHEWQKMDRVKTSDRLGFGAVALRPRIQPLMVEDKKEPKVTEEAANERKLIVLEKPVPNALREKRKAETLPSTNNIQPSLVKKTCKDEWSCALCEATTPNEITFNEHLRGKKHKRKEASLRAEKESKVSQAPAEPLSKKQRRKLRKAMAAAAAAAGGGAVGKETKDGETHLGEKTEGSVNMNALIPNFLKVGDKEDNKQINPMVF